MTSRMTRSLLRIHAWVVYVFLYAPILVLVAFSFNRATRGARWTGFTGAWYAKLLENQGMQDAMINSLIVASGTTVLATIIGTTAALGLHRRRRADRATRGLIYLPVVLPEIVAGVGLVSFFGCVGMKLSLATVVLAHVSFSVSNVAIVVKARLAGVDPSLEEAAKDLGAGPVATFFRVTLPLIAPGIVAAALLVFTVSLDEYVITSLVAGPGSTTLPLKIYSMLKVEVTPEVNAACTMLLAFTVVLIAISQRLLARGGRTG